MSLECGFVDQFGHDNPKAYWECVGLVINLKEKKITFHFDGYYNVEAFKAGKQALAQVVVELKNKDYDEMAKCSQQTLIPKAVEYALKEEFFKNAKVIQ